MRKLCCFAAPFGAAVFLAVYLLPEALWLPAGGLCAALAVLGLRLKGERRLRWIIAAFGVAAGLCWSGVYTGLFHASARALAGTEGVMSAFVTGWPRPADYGCGVTVRLLPEEGWAVNAMLYLDPLEDGSLPELRPGDRLSFTGRFHLVDTVAGEKSDYYYARDIQVTAYADAAEVRRPPGVPSPRYWPVYAARALKNIVARCFPADAAPLVTALITGDKSALPGGLYSALRRTGLAHVAAVSGLHVSFLVNALAAAAGSRRRRGAVLGIGLVFFFAAVAGNTPSVLRAAFMHSMMLLAPLADREEDKATSLSTVLMLLLIQNPYAAASISLQLSFAAVAGVYLFTGPLHRRWTARLPQGKRPWQRAVRGALCRASGVAATTVGAAVFTTPLTACYFNTVSLVSPLANVLVLPAVSLLFAAGLGTAVLGVFAPGAAAVPGWILAWLVRLVRWVTAGLSRIPFAAVGMDAVYVRLWLLLVYALFLLWLLWRGKRPRLWVPVGTGILCLCAALGLQFLSRTGGALTVSVLDVEQGLSTAFYADGHALLVDCGGSGREDAGDTAADYLQSLGLSRLDTLVLTHFHADHAGGVPQLLERLEVGTLVLPDVTPEEPLRREIEAAAQAAGAALLWVSENTDLTLGGARLRIYGPLGAGSANEEGLSVLCTSGDFDVLITGDMDGTIERRLVKYGDLPDIEVLVAGHHGSKYATSEDLLRAVRPEYAVISVGYNRYGHPAPEALERLAAAGCEIYRTDWSGTLTFTVRPDEMEKEARHAAQRKERYRRLSGAETGPP